MPYLLIITEDSTEIRSLLKSGSLAVQAEDLGEAVDTPDREGDLNRYDVALLDLDMEGWREKLLDLRHKMPVVALSRPDTRLAVEAIKLGATDYIEKPLSAGALSDIIGGYNRKTLDHKSGFDEIVGTSNVMQEVFGLIRKASAGESNVLITGESGTGKELVARAIHRWSPRCAGDFVTINCSAIPDTLLESELFGFEKGSFTGAVNRKKGILELDEGGTVFFDEIGDVSLLFQTKILRVIQEGEIMRIGGQSHIKVDVRIIAATNRDLEMAVSRGTFREDLFYRLNVINIHIPPLRNRTEDIPLLVRHFIRKHAVKRKDLLIKGITGEALNILMSYSYPGNVRELENFIERAISLANTVDILPCDLPLFIKTNNNFRRMIVPRLRDAVSTAEKDTIVTALNDSGWNISHAAVKLGIYRQQLQKKIKSLKISN